MTLAGGASSQSDRPATILIAEDDAAIRESYSYVLRHHGYNVVLAASGREAMTRLRTDHPDLILLDLIMPHMNGIDFLKAIQRHHLTTPIVVLSNLRSEADVLAVKQLGAVAMLLKSALTPRQIVNIVEQYLGQGTVAA